jgi:O-acetyl-ADP-ribose deacetylase (regulator of RNase III)
MIKEVTGDILLTKAEALVHGVAVNDNFKQGLALSLREAWPSFYKDFRHFCHSGSAKTGSLWSWKGPGKPWVISLFTQNEAPFEGVNPGKATVENINHALHALKKEISEKKLKSIAITKLATGVGGLDWNNVSPIIKDVLKDMAVTVYVYSHYEKGKTAVEK